MKKVAFFAVIAVLFLILCVGGAFMYRYANSSNLLPMITPIKAQPVVEKKVKTKQTWSDELAKIKRPDFVLPANEIFISTQNLSSLHPLWQLIINKDDIYSMFCVEQTLQNLSLQYAIIKDDSNNLIYLSTDNSELLRRAVNELKSYDIDSTIKEISL